MISAYALRSCTKDCFNVDQTLYRFQDKDEFLVVACDGIYDVMENEELCRFVESRLHVCDDLNQVCNDVSSASSYFHVCFFKSSLRALFLFCYTLSSALFFLQYMPFFRYCRKWFWILLSFAFFMTAKGNMVDFAACELRRDLLCMETLQIQRSPGAKLFMLLGWSIIIELFWAFFIKKSIVLDKKGKGQFSIDIDVSPVWFEGLHAEIEAKWPH